MLWIVTVYERNEFEIGLTRLNEGVESQGTFDPGQRETLRLLHGTNGDLVEPLRFHLSLFSSFTLNEGDLIDTQFDCLLDKPFQPVWVAGRRDGDVNVV